LRNLSNFRVVARKRPAPTRTLRTRRVYSVPQSRVPSWARNRDGKALLRYATAVHDARNLAGLARTGNLFAKGGTRLSLGRAGHSNVVLDASSAGLIRTFAEETPPTCVTQMRGVLDLLTVSTKASLLRLDDGRMVRGFAGAVDQERLKHLLGTEVVAEGSSAPASS
jgi:hypothetical protein